MVAWAHGFGVWLYALAVVLGVAAVLAHLVWVMLAFQLLGAVFLCYLGTMMIRSGIGSQLNSPDNPASPPLVEGGQASFSSTRCLSDGFFVVFLNPKIMIFFLAVFSQFLTPEQSLATQMAAAALAGVIDAMWYALVAMLVSYGQFAQRLQRHSGRIDVFFGVILWGISLTILAAVMIEAI